jgi:TRAP-type C4-dicarboxylate transport system substrate-binding protein
MNNQVAKNKWFLALIMLLCLLVPVKEAFAKKVVIKIATVAPEGSTWINAFNKLRDEVKAKTADEVDIKIYAGGVLGDERDMIRKMHIGQIQGAALSSSGLSGIFKEVDVFQIPFQFQSYAEVDYVIDKMEGFVRQGLDDSGYRLMGWSEGGFVYLMSVDPVKSLDDLKKAKVWTWEDSPMAKVIFDEAHVSAIPLSITDVLVGLQTGLVDVVYAPPVGAISMQWFTKLKYLIDVPLIYLAGAVVIQKKTFDKIPQQHQKILTECFQRHMAQLKLELRRDNQEAINVMTKHGIKVIQISDDEVNEFKDLSERAMQRLKNKSFSEKVRQEVDAHLRTFRAEKPE